jgi:hypothetical protein
MNKRLQLLCSSVLRRLEIYNQEKALPVTTDEKTPESYFSHRRAAGRQLT